MSSPPQMPGPVAQAYDLLPSAGRMRLMAVRDLVFRVAEDCEAGVLTETLKWGQPSYLTEVSKSGTTIRLGLAGKHPAVFFNCQTTLVEGFRSDFPDAFEYVGNRALILSDSDDDGALGLCLARALTYHRDKRRRKAPA